MFGQTIIWTALPNGIDRSLAEGTRTLHLSVFIAPRLWCEEASVTRMELSDFHDFEDWPAVVGEVTWKVKFGNGLELQAEPENAHLRSQLWKALFKETTTVVPFVFEDLTAAQLRTFPSATIHDVIMGVYQEVATTGKYGEGRALPDRARLATNSVLEEIARSVEGPSNEKRDAFDALTAYLESYDAAKLPTEGDLLEEYDFHDMIAALGDYPRLLRYLGLVVDLAVTLPQGTLLPAESTVQVAPTLPPMDMESKPVCPRTHYTLGAGDFLASPRTPVSSRQPSEIRGGLLRLDDPQLFRVMQMDVAGSGVKLQNTATNLVVLEETGQTPANSPDEAGLPALRTAGPTRTPPS
jgi:hypothetical protein